MVELSVRPSSLMVDIEKEVRSLPAKRSCWSSGGIRSIFAILILSMLRVSLV